MLLTGVTLALAVVTAARVTDRPSDPQAGRSVAADQPPQPSPAAVEPTTTQAVDLPVPVTTLEGRRLGDRAVYADGTMVCVLRTSHQDAGDGLAEATIQIKAVTSSHALDPRTAIVTLRYSRQSHTATLLRAFPTRPLPPGRAGTGTWVFSMPANKLGDLSVTLAPTDRHQPVTFNGASR